MMASMSDLWDALPSHGFATLFVLAVLVFLAVAVVLGILAAVMRGVGAAGGAFAKGWRGNDESAPPTQ